MKRTVIFLFTILFYLVSSQAFSLTEIEVILNAHNILRGRVNPPAEKMPNLVWSDSIANVAQTYLSKCTSSTGNLVDHNPNRSNGFTGGLGENIYGSTGSISNISRPVQSWFDEFKDYDYETNKCA